MAKTTDDEDDFIEVITPILDQPMFLLALAGGVVLGVIVLYGWQAYQKDQALRLEAAIRGASQRLDPTDDRAEEVPATPVWG